jgi:hypothetical protein
MCVRMWWFYDVIIFCSNTSTSMILNYDVLYVSLAYSYEETAECKKAYNILYCYKI